MATNKKQKFPKGVEVVGSIIVENNKGEILLTKSPNWHNKWGFPGGHIEPGEKIEEALTREAKEEVGLKLRSEGIVDSGEMISPKDFKRPAHFIYFTIFCKTNNMNVKLDNRELTEYIWITPRKALKMDLAADLKNKKAINGYLKFKKAKK